MRAGRVFIGISGYDYSQWRGRFYPEDLPRRKWLAYASERFDSIELNGTFYSLKSPDVFHVYVYFDNDHKAYAPHDALELARQVREATIP